ncbi:hypothetical protein, partial [Escherichia sp. MOD1-EC7003]
PLTDRGRKITLKLTDKSDYQLMVMDEAGQIETVRFAFQ